MRQWCTLVNVACATLIVATTARPVLAQGPALGEGPQILLQGVATILDVPVEYLLARLRSGETLATVASERGVGREALVVGTAGWVAGASYVQQLMGAVTAQEVRERVDRTRGAVSENLDRPFPAVPPVLPRSLLQDAADLLYLQPLELTQQLQGGHRTIGEIAASEGLSREDVIGYLLERLEGRLTDGARPRALT